MSKKIRKIKRWRELDISEWKSPTYHAYMADRHKEIFGIDYVTNSYGFEGTHMNLFIEEHGHEMLKRFIDACFADYRPSAKWPGVNFGLMSTRMKSRILPRVQMQMKAEKLLSSNDTPIEKTEHSENINELKEWF